MTATDTTDKPRVEQVQGGPDGVPEWRAWIPPRGPEDYEGDPAEGITLAPYGSSYWHSEDEAADFIEEVTGERPEGHPKPTHAVTVAVTASGDTREDAIDALEEALRRLRGGFTSGHDRAETSRFAFEVTDGE